LSHKYPQRNEAGIAKNKARAVIIPISTNDPPMLITYRGRKTDSKPNAIS
jgi:hypothetical protein